MPEVVEATVEDLMGKQPRTATKTLKLSPERHVKVTVKALGSDVYDDLVAKHPPTTEQAKEGASFDGKTFAPALVAACLVQPQMSEEQTKELFAKPEWAGGELGGLFNLCLGLCLADLDADFTDAG